MLTEEEIHNCLEEHHLFLRKYISPSVYVTCDRVSQDGAEQASIFHGFSGGMGCLYSCMYGYIKPNRDLFFQCIGTLGNFSKCVEIGVADGSNSSRILNNLNPEGQVSSPKIS